MLDSEQRELKQNIDWPQRIKDNFHAEISDPQIINSLPEEAPDIVALLRNEEICVPSNRFCTNNDGKVEYIKAEMNSDSGQLSLLHELGHRFFKHSGKVSDLENLKNEKVAWLYAIKMASKVGLEMTDSLVSMVLECVQTYVDFIAERSHCYSCGSLDMYEFSNQVYTCRSCYSDQ